MPAPNGTNLMRCSGSTRSVDGGDQQHTLMQDAIMPQIMRQAERDACARGREDRHRSRRGNISCQAEYQVVGGLSQGRQGSATLPSGPLFLYTKSYDQSNNGYEKSEKGPPANWREVRAPAGPA
jgi:hypothetical protein